MMPMKNACLGACALACTLAAGALAARTIESVTPTASGFTLAFGTASAGETNNLFAVWGAVDAGTDDPAAWENTVLLGAIAPETASYAYTVDAATVKGPFLRFVLQAPFPYDVAVDYIESTADGAYAQTAFTPTGRAAVEANVTFTSFANNGSVFCARQGGGNLAASTFTLFRLGTDLRWDYNATGSSGTFTLALNTPYALRADYTGISANGTKRITEYGTLKDYTAGGPMVLFASYGGTDHVPNGNWARMRLASFKAWRDYADDTSLALDLVPCKKDGAAALYDKVSKALIPLTGSFATGPERGAASAATVFSDLQVLPRRVIIAQEGTLSGTLEPACGVAAPAAGTALVCSAADKADARHFTVSCAGYTLETWNGSAWGEPVAHDGSASYTYPADATDVQRLTWKWTCTAAEGWADNLCFLADGGVALVVDNAAKAWFKDWLADKGLTAAEACTYDEIRYAGAGEITNVSEIAAYTGVVRVQEGAQVVAAAGNAFGAAKTATLHVEKGGCVRIWSAAKNGTKLRVKTAYIAGRGRDGNGALYSTCPGGSTVVWPLNIVLADDARIGWANANQDLYGITFDLNGHDLNLLSRVNSYDRLGSDSVINDTSAANNGRVIIDNAILFEGAVTYCATGYHELVFRTNGHYRTNGNHGYGSTGDWTNHWKMVIAGPCANDFHVALHAGIGRNGWRAPVELKVPSALYRQNCYSSQTLFGPVSGAYGLGVCEGHSLTWWRLANPHNTFTGGVSLRNDCFLSAWTDGAVPAGDGAGPVTFQNGCTFWLTDGVDYHLPDLKLTGTALTYTGLVHGASSGAFKTVTKADATLMNWRSGTGAAVLDLQRGVFRIPSPLAGLYEGFTNVANAGASDRAAATNAVQLLPLAMRLDGNAAYRADRGTTGTYRGYLWNRSAADVTWGFACSYNSTFCMYIDDERVLYQTSATSPVFAQKTLSPGAHAFEIRYQGNTTQGTKVDGCYPWSDQYKGWGVDRKRGGARTNTSDYVVLSDPGDGSLFTLAKTLDELPQACRLTPPVFATLVATNLAYKPVLDLCGNALAVTNVVGAPVVTNMAVGLAANTFTVLEKWTLATKPGTGAKRVSVGAGRVTGTLVLGTDEAAVTIDADEPALLDRAQDYTLVTADALVVKKGRPALCEALRQLHWRVAATPDGKSLFLHYSAGATLLVR